MHHSLAEEIFLAALLQDVGMFALDKAVPDFTRQRILCSTIMPHSPSTKKSACKSIMPKSAAG